MELMWLVYAVENLTYSGDFTKAWFTTIGVIAGLVILVGGICSIDGGADKVLVYVKKLPYKTVTVLSVIILITSAILPTRETAIKMAGAYLIQQVVVDDKTQQLGNAAYKAAMRQLDKWSEEVPELADMIADTAKDEVVKRLKTDK
ncbi:hypothetical protein S140_140 [Shewanella sp. phage 1/40]|uniref:hypothetical protein n=1 Tax=Shewanella sp. phage 1/40 TaxID=1458860 RepID=UPI0004F72AEA|nr:hypothetical protein S140_140 [Shewanella sp. phage 1/40]AHK11547.1 hypothetical protein S140_140 [Shewanella sp. phage 1/40]